MKIVHSFWSRPALASSDVVGRANGGWRYNKYQFMSWALSCLSFKKQYGKIELVTDLEGQKVLIDQLNLPYTSVRLDLEQLNSYPKELWAIGKLYAYSIQDEPFLHVDGDVYIWEKFSAALEKAQLIGQHVDTDEGHYDFGIQQLVRRNIAIPFEMKRDFATHKKFKATNAGILGGTNLDFFKEYVDRAFWFINKNLKKVDSDMIGSSYALIYEQYLFSVMARQQGLIVKHYIDDEREELLGLSNFRKRYGSKKYVHLLGEAKFAFESCRELELNLLLDFPEYHERIIKIFT